MANYGRFVHLNGRFVHYLRFIFTNRKTQIILLIKYLIIKS
jgi:hypothetical protein